MRLLLLTCAVLALSACQKAQQPKADQADASPPAQGGKGVDRSHKGNPAPEKAFIDPDGEATSLKEFAGKPTLVNLWASWCAPCVKELPTLDKLAQAQGDKLNVIALSQDSGPRASVEAFLQEHKIAALDPYQDPKMSMSGALGAEVLPTTILYDAKGSEVWRYVGDQDWTSAQAARLLAEAGVRAKAP